MDAELKMDKIFSQVQKLDKTQQKSLLKRLTLLLTVENQTHGKMVTLADLAGLGHDVWRDTDIDKYVEDERQW